MSSRMILAGLAVALSLPVSGCERAGSESRPAVPAYIDSAMSRDESLRRFRAGLTDVVALTGGASTLDELARAFVHSISANDTTGARKLAVTRGEFAFLIYPTDPQGLPPYNLAPGLRWFMLESGSEKGLHAALRAFGGRPLTYLGVQCPGDSSTHGENTMWGPCLVRLVTAGGDTTQQRLFGTVVRRRGQYKLVSFANDL